jgi:hypothetical protein
MEITEFGIVIFDNDDLTVPNFIITNPGENLLDFSIMMSILKLI